MDTASLKIKFTPLMKKIHLDNSTCCLEIVPEVSALKNFDKIKWKKENNFYEYLIPMTYKIILKRREYHNKDAKDYIDNLHPMYHSCVDLLHPSVTSYFLASGDVSKTVSDNFILSKVTSDIDRCNIILSQHKEICCAKNIKAKVIANVQTVAAWDKDNATISDTLLDGQENQNNEVTKIKPQVDSFNNIVSNVKNCQEKGTHINQETVSPLCIIENNSSDNTIDRIVAQRIQNESLRKLSVTPICSINTNTSPLSTLPHENSFFSNSFFSRDYESNKEIAVFGNLSPIPKQTFSVYTTSINVDNYMPKKIATFRKFTPEERIEQFMKLMEKEIMPLKHMLNDLIAKYSALDKTPFFLNDITLNRKLHTNKGFKGIEGPDEKLRSNRVVFNVIFDG